MVIGWDLSIKLNVILKKNLPMVSQFFGYNFPLEQVKEYKSLANYYCMLSDKSLLKETSKVLAKWANKAYFSLMKKLSSLSFPESSLMCRLFVWYINYPIEYDSEAWNLTVSDNNNDSLEIIYHKVCKLALS